MSFSLRPEHSDRFEYSNVSWKYRYLKWNVKFLLRGSFVGYGLEALRCWEQIFFEVGESALSRPKSLLAADIDWSGSRVHHRVMANFVDEVGGYSRHHSTTLYNEWFVSYWSFTRIRQISRRKRNLPASVCIIFVRPVSNSVRFLGSTITIRVSWEPLEVFKHVDFSFRRFRWRKFGDPRNEFRGHWENKIHSRMPVNSHMFIKNANGRFID